MFEKRRREAKQKALIQHQRHTRENPGVFLMCDNGFKSLGSPKIFDGLRYRKWRMKEESLDDPDPVHLV